MTNINSLRVRVPDERPIIQRHSHPRPRRGSHRTRARPRRRHPPMEPKPGVTIRTVCSGKEQREISPVLPTAEVTEAGSVFGSSMKFEFKNGLFEDLDETNRDQWHPQDGDGVRVPALPGDRPTGIR